MMDFNYGYGYPPGFQPSMQRPFQPSQFSQSQQMQPPQQNGPDWVMVPTVKDVEQVSVSPGGKAWVMVQNEAIFSIRTANQMGLITTDYYKFEQYNPEASAAPSPEYVTREEFQDFIKTLNKQPEKTKKEVANNESTV